MPISEKQLEANRRNAQHSTGPKTVDGKATSSRNNLRHGLTGQITVLPTEDRDAHEAFCNELVASLKPGTPMECQLAQSIAEDSWRLNRAVAIETNMFALGHGHERRPVQLALADARTFQERAAQFNLLSLYEQRINRNRQRNLKQLQELQTHRRAQPRNTEVEQHEEVTGRNGFDFSNDEIARGAAANAAQPTEFEPPKPAAGHQYVTARTAVAQSTPAMEIKRAA